MPTIVTGIRLLDMSSPLPLYTEDDAFATLKLVRPLPNDGVAVEVAKGVRAGFRIAGHILNSLGVLVEIEGAGADGAGHAFCFLRPGHYDQPIIHDPVPPPLCDYLLVESTYGDRLHDPENPGRL